MSGKSRMPDFTDGKLEIRIDGGEVAVYGTRDGLRSLTQICTKLADRRLGKDGTDHVHLEDHGLLTSRSVIAAIAVFEPPAQP